MRNLYFPKENSSPARNRLVDMKKMSESVPIGRRLSLHFSALHKCRAFKNGSLLLSYKPYA